MERSLRMKTRRNPIIPDTIADPSVVEFDGIYYLYGTTDIGMGLGTSGPPVVWKSKDFVNWSFQGCIFPDVDWSISKFWAPGRMLRRMENGKYKYYLYFSASEVEGEDKELPKPDPEQTFVAVADSPEGPFVTANGPNKFSGFNKATPILDTIDGDPFVDDDGVGYIGWRYHQVAKMNQDWLSIDKDTVFQIPIKQGDAYSEGSWIFKRNNIYYYMYTLSGHANYKYAYVMSKESPLGPYIWVEEDVIATTDFEKGIWGPGHGCVFQPQNSDKAIFVYLEYGEGGTTRQVHADWMEFNEDGTIQPINLTWEGIGTLGEVQEQPVNLAVNAKVMASSVRPSKMVTGVSDGQSISREVTYDAENAVDGSNGTRWWAADEDANPWLMVDLQEVKQIDRCELSFIFPTFGHAYKVEKSNDGRSWIICKEITQAEVCSPHFIDYIGETRYLKVTITEGKPGLWNFKIY
mgnify:CR=1 FL=1